MRAASGLHAHDAIRRQGLVTNEELRVLAGVDVVGDDGHLEALPELPAEPAEQSRTERDLPFACSERVERCERGLGSVRPRPCSLDAVPDQHARQRLAQMPVLEEKLSRLAVCEETLAVNAHGGRIQAFPCRVQ